MQFVGPKARAGSPAGSERLPGAAQSEALLRCPNGSYRTPARTHHARPACCAGPGRGAQTKPAHRGHRQVARGGQAHFRGGPLTRRAAPGGGRRRRAAARSHGEPGRRQGPTDMRNREGRSQADRHRRPGLVAGLEAAGRARHLRRPAGTLPGGLRQSAQAHPAARLRAPAGLGP